MSERISRVEPWGSNMFRVYGESGKELKTLHGEQLVGYTSNTVTIRKGNWYTTYDANGKELSSKPL